MPDETIWPEVAGHCHIAYSYSRGEMIVKPLLELMHSAIFDPQEHKFGGIDRLPLADGVGEDETSDLMRDGSRAYTLHQREHQVDGGKESSGG